MWKTTQTLTEIYLGQKNNYIHQDSHYLCAKVMLYVKATELRELDTYEMIHALNTKMY